MNDNGNVPSISGNARVLENTSNSADVDVVVTKSVAHSSLFVVMKDFVENVKEDVSVV